MKSVFLRTAPQYSSAGSSQRNDHPTLNVKKVPDPKSLAAFAPTPSVKEEKQLHIFKIKSKFTIVKAFLICRSSPLECQQKRAWPHANCHEIWYTVIDVSL